MGWPNGANQPFTSCAGALGWVSKHLQGAEKQTGRIRQPEKNSYLPTGQAAGHLRPNKLRPNQLKRMPTCSWAVFWNHWHPLRCVCVTLPRPGMPAHASSEPDPAYW